MSLSVFYIFLFLSFLFRLDVPVGSLILFLLLFPLNMCVSSISVCVCVCVYVCVIVMICPSLSLGFFVSFFASILRLRPSFLFPLAFHFLFLTLYARCVQVFLPKHSACVYKYLHFALFFNQHPWRLDTPLFSLFLEMDLLPLLHLCHQCLRLSPGHGTILRVSRTQPFRLLLIASFLLCIFGYHMKKNSPSLLILLMHIVVDDLWRQQCHMDKKRKDLYKIWRAGGWYDISRYFSNFSLRSPLACGVSSTGYNCYVWSLQQNCFLASAFNSSLCLPGTKWLFFSANLTWIYTKANSPYFWTQTTHKTEYIYIVRLCVSWTHWKVWELNSTFSSRNLSSFRLIYSILSDQSWTSPCFFQPPSTHKLCAQPFTLLNNHIYIHQIKSA